MSICQCVCVVSVCYVLLCVCLCCLCLALKWKRGAAIHDTQALSAATGMKTCLCLLPLFPPRQVQQPPFATAFVVVVVVAAAHANRYICSVDFDYKFRRNLVLCFD